MTDNPAPSAPPISIPDSFLGSNYREVNRYRLHRGIPVVVEVEPSAPGRKAIA